MGELSGAVERLYPSCTQLDSNLLLRSVDCFRPAEFSSLGLDQADPTLGFDQILLDREVVFLSKDQVTDCIARREEPKDA